MSQTPEDPSRQTPATVAAVHRELADGELVVTPDAGVDDAVRGTLVQALEALEAVHDWWADGLRLDRGGETEAHQGLVLRANLTLIGYESGLGDLIEIDEEDDAFMAWMDLCVIVDWLTARSRDLGLGFELSFAGQSIGVVSDGEENEALGLFLVALGERVGAELDEGDDQRAEALDEAYAERR